MQHLNEVTNQIIYTKSNEYLELPNILFWSLKLCLSQTTALSPLIKLPVMGFVMKWKGQLAADIQDNIL